MTDGCKHAPVKDLPGYEVDSFVSGPHCGTDVCKLTKTCDSRHVFVVHNLHLYNVGIVAVDARSFDGHIEVCDETGDAAKRTEWHMTGEVPAAQYRRPRNALPYGEVRLPTDVRSVLPRASDHSYDYIEVNYSIVSPVNGPMEGMSFNVPVDLF